MLDFRVSSTALRRHFQEKPSEIGLRPAEFSSRTESRWMSSKLLAYLTVTALSTFSPKNNDTRSCTPSFIAFLTSFWLYFNTNSTNETFQLVLFYALVKCIILYIIGNDPPSPFIPICIFNSAKTHTIILI